MKNSLLVLSCTEMEILTIKIKKSSEIISCTINGKKSNNNEQYKTGGT